ncbi:MAG: ABC transporter ATP-binding protein [Vicinamibacteria bacterium]|jgi:ABC-2 type transport system ATP-binding protein|nr:ABC transporter ATP-binding protein [Vicinamibacteria bacterium]
MSTIPLQVEAVSVRHGRPWLLQGVSFEVKPGEVVALLGRNGVGKTSLLRVALGLMPSAVGGVRVFGRDPWRQRARALARVGVVPDTPDAPPELDARGLCRLVAALHERWDDTATRARLVRFEVPERVPFARLSRGQKGAVMLALALGHEPDLLVLDEPTLGLDVIARDAYFGELIAELSDRGTAVVLASHDLALVERLAERAIVLHDGAVAADLTIDALKSRFRQGGEPLDLEAAFARLALRKAS